MGVMALGAVYRHIFIVARWFYILEVKGVKKEGGLMGIWPMTPKN